VGLFVGVETISRSKNPPCKLASCFSVFSFFFLFFGCFGYSTPLQSLVLRFNPRTSMLVRSEVEH
jgi:hypothetical protein